MLANTTETQSWFIHGDVALPVNAITKVQVIDGDTRDKNVSIRVFTGTTEVMFSFPSVDTLNETLGSLGLKYSLTGSQQGL